MTETERRYFVEHHVMRDIRDSDQLVAYFDTLEEAKAAADRVWAGDAVSRQQISDTETGDTLYRAGPDQNWHPKSGPG